MTNGNAPAFPTGYNDWERQAQGMTLRQWFAGLAMQGLVQIPPGEITDLKNKSDFGSWVAAASVEMADAVLAELANKTVLRGGLE